MSSSDVKSKVNCPKSIHISKLRQILYKKLSLAKENSRELLDC